MGKLFKFSLFTAVVVFCLCFGTSAQRSSYGEACSKTRRCERRAWLNCFNGTCGCIRQDEMLYEPEMGKCAARSGERCKFAMEDPDGNTVFETNSCISNASCSQDGYCSCTEEFYENINGTCSAKGKYEEICDDKTPCSESNGLSCVEGSCVCNQHSEFSAEYGKCVGLAGQACVDGICTENSFCTTIKDIAICNCDADYFEGLYGKCVPKLDFGENCTSDDQCIQETRKDLKCVYGKCICNTAYSLYGTAQRHQMRCHDHEFYQFEPMPSTQCLGKEGSPCIDGYCAPGAYCRYNDVCSSRYGRAISYTGTCRCLRGHTRSHLGNCGIPYGSACQSGATCIDGLVCGGTCRCRYDSQTYDSSNNKCISPVGGPCNKLTGCTAGADCVNIGTNAEGTCQCKRSFIEAAGRTCQLRFGMSCTSSSTCDVLTGLQCIEGTCQCKGFQRYSEEKQQCLGLVGAKCHLKIDSRNQCIENTRCVQSRGETDAGRCTCTEGFVINGNYTCDDVDTSIVATTATLGASIAEATPTLSASISMDSTTVVASFRSSSEEGLSHEEDVINHLG